MARKRKFYVSVIRTPGRLLAFQATVKDSRDKVIASKLMCRLMYGLKEGDNVLEESNDASYNIKLFMRDKLWFVTDRHSDSFEWYATYGDNDKEITKSLGKRTSILLRVL